VAVVTSGRTVRVTDESGTSQTLTPADLGGLDELGGGRVRLRSPDGRLVDGHVEERLAADGRPILEVVVEGWRFVFTVEDEERAGLMERARIGSSGVDHHGRTDVRSVIPGRIVSVDVAEGAIVASGDRLLVVEAMKMQNEIRAPRDGTVVRIAVGAGGTVEIGSVLVVLG
jgi:biotin carboxyl carrier protein